MFSLQKFGFALIPPCGGHKQRFKIGQKYAKIGWFNPLLRQFHANYGSFFWCLGVPISGQIHMGDLSKWMRLWVNPDVSRQKKRYRRNAALWRAGWQGRGNLFHAHRLSHLATLCKKMHLQFTAKVPLKRETCQ
jgi:hypothetical protein